MPLSNHPLPSTPFRHWPILAWLTVFLFVGTAAMAAPERSSDGYPIWSADNIQMVYLKDSTQFVCDPDHILSQEYKDSANYYLHRMKMEMDIQTVFIIVRHVKNGDPFRMAQDVGNRYGVGYKDTRTGLVVVIATEDKQYFIAPGKGLEAYLTDVSCGRIGRNFIQPNMRNSNPDLAVSQTCYAIYKLLKEGELPPSTSISDPVDDEEGFGIIEIIIIIIIIAYLWRHGGKGGGIYIGGGGFGGGFGGGGFSSGGGGFGGGSFGGGSFGGGGAGGGW